MNRLTARQAAILAFIGENVRFKGYPPSVREIADHFGLHSASGVHKHLKALVRKEYLSKEKFRSRSIRVLKSSSGDEQTPPTVPVLPFAGALDGWAVHGNGTHAPRPSPLPASVALYPREAYLLAVPGDAWLAHGLRDGDHLLVMPHHPIRPGVAVLASIEARELALGRFFREGDQVTLAGLVETHPTRTFPARAVHIRGVIGGIWRALPETAPPVA